MTYYNSLKKVRKNVKKEFVDANTLAIRDIFSKNLIKRTVKILDILSNPLPVVIPGEDDMISVLQSIIEELYNGPLSVDPNDVEANEFIQIVSSLHWRTFCEAYTETATKRYNMPELPESAAFAISGLGVYGMRSNLMTSKGSVVPMNAISAGELASKSELNGALSDLNYTRPSLIGATSNAGYIDLKKSKATLTGGGGGPALPPVQGAVRLVSFEKNIGEDLGITVVQQQYMSAQYGLVKELVIKRILTASKIEQHGLLHEGDVIREANGVPVDTPQALQRLLRNAVGTITLKIIPSYQPSSVPTQLFLRAYFSYNPKKDNLIPCKEAGLFFNAGDVLQVLKREDPHWWQARHYDHQQRAGLIPSISLQERRRAFVQSAPNPEELTQKMIAFGLARRRRKKVVIPFRVRDAEQFETKDLVLYEEVALISGFQRPVICLLAAPGVGRHSLRNMLVRAYPDRYGTPVMHTTQTFDANEDELSRFELDTHANMEREHLNNEYLEFGEYEDNYYGTKLDSIREVIRSGRTCLLACSVQAVSRIRNSEFMPYVVFLAAPSVSCMKAMYEYGMSMGFTDRWKRDEHFRKSLEMSMQIEQNYRHLLDTILLCDNFESTFEQLSECLNVILVSPQWVPAKWLY